jgi:hypothetical protein
MFKTRPTPHSVYIFYNQKVFCLSAHVCIPMNVYFHSIHFKHKMSVIISLMVETIITPKLLYVLVFCARYSA